MVRRMAMGLVVMVMLVTGPGCRSKGESIPATATSKPVHAAVASEPAPAAKEEPDCGFTVSQDQLDRLTAEQRKTFACGERMGFVCCESGEEAICAAMGCKGHGFVESYPPGLVCSQCTK